MKVKELIQALEEFDGELEVMALNPYRQETSSVTICRLQYETLDKKYVYIG